MLAKILVCLIAILGCMWQNTLQGERINGEKTVPEMMLDICTYLSIFAFSILICCSGINLLTLPKICLFLTGCTYCRNKKRKKMCTPFWKMLRIAIFTSMGMAAIKIVILLYDLIQGKMLDEGNDWAVCILSTLIWIFSAIVLKEFFEKKLKSRKAARFYY